MISLKLTQIGNSTGFVLPKEVLDKMNVSKGDVIYLTETADGFRITPYNTKFEQQMAVAHDVMKKRRNVLRELAK